MAVDFNSVSRKLKTFTVSDLTAIKEKCVNVRPKKEGLFPDLLPYSKIEVNPTAYSPSRFYKVGDDKYIYTSDGKVRVFGTGAALENATFSNTPELVSVVFGGTIGYFLVSADKSYSFTSGGTSTFSGEFFSFFGNSVFIIKNGELKFSLPFDFLDSSGNLKATETYSPEKEIGKAIALTHDYDKLYILCEKGIITADFNDAPEKYYFKGVKYADLSVISDSALCVGDKIYFFSGNDFCVTDGGKIKKLSSLPKNRDYGITGKPFYIDGTYFTEIHIDFDNEGGKYLAVDSENGVARFIHASGCTFCGRESGVIYRTADNSFYTHGEDGNVLSGERSFKSLPLSFGSAEEKRIVGFSAYSEDSPTVKITGDNGTFAFKLKKGYDKKRANVVGREFIIEITSEGKFTLKDLKIKYTEN